MNLNRVLSSFLILSFFWLHGQDDPEYKFVATINSDNDAFVIWENRDRYYTYGIGASLAFRSDKLLGLQNWFKNKDSHFFTGGMRIEGYTPTNKVVTEGQLEGDSIVVFDRPFAGLLFGTLETTYGFKRSLVRTGILAGIMGPSSGAGRLQRWIHDNVTQDGVFDAWRFQLPDQFIFNISGEYLYDFNPNNKYANVYGAVNARLGNLYIDASPTLGFRFGKFNGINKTAAFGTALQGSKTDWELYIHSSFSATLAGFNATAQGRLFGPTYEYALEEINNFYLSMSHGLYVTYRRIMLAYDLFFTYGEVVENQQHIYARLEIKYRF